MTDITEAASVKVDISPTSMGKAFARMDSQEQAEFFSGIYLETVHWPKDCGFQWAHLLEDLRRDPDAMSVFKKLAEYASDDLT